MHRLKIFRNLICLAILLPLCVPAAVFAAFAPSEVISNIRYIKKGGVRAIRMDFAFPVHYVTHYPSKRSDTLNINLHFKKKEVSDLSQLPLLQSMTPPRSRHIPLTEVTYLTENNSPKLVLKFSREVRYSVSQIMGVKSLLVFLPDTFKGKSTTRSRVKLPPIIKGKVTKSRAENMYRRGRRALQQGKNRVAIQIFSSLLSIPKHVYTQESLELLGLARERNGQKAHAKSAYSEYVEKYKTDKNAVRVKQRLADLISARQKPKKRLKNRPKKKQKRDAYRSTFFASFSQFFDYSLSAIDIDEDKGKLETNGASLDNQFLMSWRVRSGNYDIRNSFYANYEFDTISKESDGFEISTMYSKIKNSAAGVYMTVGRQSSQAAGVLTKFDGLLFGYDLAEKFRINLVTGYPVFSTKKTEVQTKKLFNSVSFEFNNLFGALDISPYIYEQVIDNIVNRSAVGAEVRFFHDKGDFFGLYDRDTFFDTSNILLLRGKYLLQKQTSIRINYDKRRSPSLQMENVLNQLNPDLIETIGDINIVSGVNYSVADLKQKALAKTGESRLLTVGLSHSFSSVLYVTIERSSSATVSPTVTRQTTVSPTDPTLLPDDIAAQRTLAEIPDRFLRKSNDFNFQFVTSQSFYRRDSTIVSFRSGRASNSRSNLLSLEYRWPFTTNLRMNVRLKLLSREDYNDRDPVKGRLVSTTRRASPSVKFDLRSGKQLRIYGELAYKDDQGVSETKVAQTKSTNKSRESNWSGFLGYTWEF